MPILRLILWALLVGAAWLFRTVYNAWPGPWILACTVALPPVLFLLSLPSMLGLKVQLEGPARVVRGAKAEYSVRFDNARLLPVHSVTVRLALCNRYTGNVKYKTCLVCNLESCRLWLPLPTDECGVISCRILRCELRDPLGLFALRRCFDGEYCCAVLPEAQTPGVNLDAALDVNPVLKPKHGSGFAEDYDLRDYRPGDLPNSIHWKLSSKTDGLVVREALVPENDAVYLVLEQPGSHDEGLAVLRGLSFALNSREEPQISVADSMYPIWNGDETDAALIALLSGPMGPPCDFDPNTARCVFRVSGSEVRVE